MKKWLSLLIVASAMLFLSAGMVHAASSAVPTPKLILDGKVLKSAIPPVLMEKSVMIPVRIVTENLGYKVLYDNKKKQVTVSNSVNQLVMTLNKPIAYLDKQPLKMLVPPTLKSSNTLIPLRFLADSLGVQIFWDNTSKSAFMYSSSNTEDKPKPDGEIVGGIDGDGNTDVGITNPKPTPEPNPVPDPGNNPDPVPTTPIPDQGTIIEPEIPANPLTRGNVHQVRYESDTIVLKYDGVLLPTVTTLDNPKRVVIDLPNTDYAAGFLPALPIDPSVGKQGELLVADHPALQKVRYSLYADKPKALRFVLDLNQAWDYEIQNNLVNGEFFIILKQPVPDKSLFTVVLDAGHGGSDPGAKSINGRWEKDFNLIIVKKVQALLAGDERINLVLTRQDDSYPSLDDRVNLANSIGADLFISVHANSFTASTNGTETYYTRPDSLEFAKFMHSLLTSATGLKDNGVRNAGFKVIKYTKMPAVLLEAGYLSSKIDEPKLWTEAVQNRIADAIAAGIKQYLKLS
ncbi:N-acetylmuramoyl-L-alanine amidase [Cohnella sp.]|uniref:N-acetylmuramoyl-L-alanine amidase n=1 Tax=Cohnella sp. TaxID=1883426 RepID=UPI00356359FF